MGSIIDADLPFGNAYKRAWSKLPEGENKSGLFAYCITTTLRNAELWIDLLPNTDTSRGTKWFNGPVVLRYNKEG